VDANRVVATSLFEPVEKFDIVATIGGIVASIVVDVDEFRLTGESSMPRVFT
jgi:hypothetical protein